MKKEIDLEIEKIMKMINKKAPKEEINKEIEKLDKLLKQFFKGR